MRRWGVRCAVAVLVLTEACGGGRGSATARREAGRTGAPAAGAPAASFDRFPVPAGSAPHDVAPAPDGTVWYTAQAKAALGRLDPATGRTTEVPLGQGSAPHGVIIGPDGAAWVTDPGLNSVLRVDPVRGEVKRFPLPPERKGAVVHTAAFDRRGTLWFTGNAGVYGRLDPATGAMQVWDAPKGPGPYGITATPDGTVWFASLSGHYIARVDPNSGQATVIEPPTPNQGARRIWTDSRGRLWVSEWDAGQVGRYDPAAGSWKEWRLPGDKPQAYAVYVDDRDEVWLSDFGGNSIVRFDPGTESFSSHPLPDNPGNVRQILGRPGEVWGAESAADALLRLRTSPLGG